MSGWMLSIDFGASNTVAAHTNPIRGTVEPMVVDDAVRPIEVVYERTLAAHHGQRPKVVVLTHPDAWSEQQIRTLADAGARAGIDARTIMTVSEARATVEYCTQGRTLRGGSVYAVCDFGGTSLDTAVVVVTEAGGFEVVAARGDDTLGGRTLDAAVRRWAEGVFTTREPGFAAQLQQASLGVHREFDEQARRAKEALTSEQTATIAVTLDGSEHAATLTREEFDAAITPHIDRVVETMWGTLTDAGFGVGDLDVLCVTGGSARIPLLRNRLAHLGPLAAPSDPAVVAEGALILAENSRQSLRARAIGWIRPVGIVVASALIVAGVAVAAVRGLPENSSARGDGTAPVSTESTVVDGGWS
ncbi:Hsp70 family protein [Rhodococcus sp. HNM0563]|uniref:Hsp70 family protein n=2 Tax=unclassified Rhodococcus (in: high G+C Gram-positive bacteria) TaxID=192944 RepID=UPI00146A1D4E|nr:Hsp70 family protein [Rhodococcus sp. HNM0563]NLU62510.1 Hsp70 family protein [Rhodococcus sp. HNM0563]